MASGRGGRLRASNGAVDRSDARTVQIGLVQRRRRRATRGHRRCCRYPDIEVGTAEKAIDGATGRARQDRGGGEASGAGHHGCRRNAGDYRG